MPTAAFMEPLIAFFHSCRRQHTRVLAGPRLQGAKLSLAITAALSWSLRMPFSSSVTNKARRLLAHIFASGIFNKYHILKCPLHTDRL